MKKYFTNFLLIIISLLVSILIIEIILRFTHYSKIGREYGYPVGYFKEDAEIGYDIEKSVKDKIHDIKEYSYPIFSNKFGCFDYERQVNDEFGLIVGDSMTWGYTNLENKWTSVLENDSGIQMLKCGITGHGTKQELAKAKKVIKEVGKKPKYLVVMYISNDFDDDFLFPTRTVKNGYLANRVKNVNTQTGSITFLSDEEIDAKYQEYIDSRNSLSRKIRYSFVSYRIYKALIQPSLKRKKTLKKYKKQASLDSKQNPEVKKEVSKNLEMPQYLDSSTGFNLSYYFDTYDKKWYNQALQSHQKNIMNFKDYAKEIGAELIFIDAHGVISHKRFDNVRKHLGKSYYNLTDDYKNQSTWKFDGHWDIQGNQDAGKYIFNHYKKIGLLK